MALPDVEMLLRASASARFRLRQTKRRWVLGPNRTWLLLVTAAIVPLLLFGGWAGALSAEHMRSNTRALVRAKVDLVAERISTELAAQLNLGEALASSTALDTGDLAAFRLEVQRFQAMHPLWQTVQLSGPDGIALLSLLQHGTEAPSPTTTTDPGFQSALHTREPAVGGLGPDQAAPAVRLVTLQVPVIRQGNLQYILTVAMAPDAIEAILNEAGAPADWVGVVLDASGHVLAHTRSEGEQLGQVASLTLRGAIAPNTADFHIGFTPQGLQVETVARILPDTGGWTVAFGIPAATLRQPVRRALFLLAAACLASLALSAAMAVLLTRDMNQRRDDERSRAERALRASEERRAMAIEAAELGSWRWDIASDQFDGSERCLLMLELSPAAHGAAWQEVMAAVHPDDCSSLGCAVQECLTGRGHFCAEFRVEQRDGGQRWVRATGRLLAGENDQPDSLQGVMDNITARKRAEAERLDLLRRLAQAQEEERGRISRDLHDQVGQTVTGLSLSLKALEQEDGISPAHVHALQELVAGISRDIHRAAADLRPSALDDLGLLRALRALAANIADAAGIRIDVQALGYERRLSSEIETIIYRLVQESLTNILKHAHAHAVSVLLDHTAQEIRVIVEDDGIGFNVAAQADGSDVSHIGLSGMRERLALIGGSMMIESDIGSGTTLFMQVPILERSEETDS